MLACYWIAVDPDGRNYVYRELCKPNLTASDAAKEILNYTMPDENIITTFVPPDMWNRQKDTGKTIAEVFLENGLGITKADNNLFQGGMQIKEFLKDMPDGRPAIVFFDTCKQVIEHISIIQADEKDPNKYAKIPHDITHTCIAGDTLVSTPDGDFPIESLVGKRSVLRMGWQRACRSKLFICPQTYSNAEVFEIELDTGEK